MLQQQREVGLTVVLPLKRVPEPGQEVFNQAVTRTVPVVAKCPAPSDERVCVGQTARCATAPPNVSNHDTGTDLVSSPLKERRFICRSRFLDNSGIVVLTVIPSNAPTVGIALTGFVGNRE
jgi:hypothetical protein